MTQAQPAQAPVNLGSLPGIGRIFPHPIALPAVLIVQQAIPSPTDIRCWDAELQPLNMALTPALSPTNKLKASLQRILLEAGIALTQAYSPWSPDSWFALFRYAFQFLNTGPSLDVASAPGLKVGHVTRASSEEIATGITTFVMREHLGVLDIADVGPLLTPPGVLTYHRGRKEPDYIGSLASGHCILVESKGRSFKTQSTIDDAITKGRAQVGNIRSTQLSFSKTPGGYVIGTEFCKTGGQSSTRTIIADPPTDQTRDESDPKSVDVIIRQAYAKFFRFMAQDAIADLILGVVEFSLPNRWDDYIWDISYLIGVQNVREIVTPIGITPFGDLMAIDKRIMNVLMSGKDNLRERLAAYRDNLSDKIIIEPNRGYAMSNGIVVLFGLRGI